MTIVGRNFLAGIRAQVSDGKTGQSVALQNVLATSLTAIIPASAQSLGIKTLTLTNPDGQSASVNFTVTPGAPVRLNLASLEFSTTASGRAFSVRLSGANIFRTVRATLNGAPTPVMVTSSTEAIVEVPASLNEVGGITVSLRLTSLDEQSTGASLRINRRPPPTIQSVTRVSGNQVRVGGINFLGGLRSALDASSLMILSQEEDTAFTAQIPATFRLVPNSPTVSLLVNNPDQQTHGVLLPRSFFDGSISFFDNNLSFQTASGTKQNERTWENTALMRYFIAEVGKEKQHDKSLKDLEIYPNPIEGELRISGARQGTVRLYDMRGGIALEERTVSGVVNVSALCAGMYIVVVETADGRVVRQRVVKR